MAAKDTGGWRWTFDRPELRFIIKKTEGVHAVADFSIAGDTMKVTGPVTVSFFVNNKLIAKEKYAKAGGLSLRSRGSGRAFDRGQNRYFRHGIEDRFLSPRVMANILGLILVRAGFVS